MHDELISPKKRQNSRKRVEKWLIRNQQYINITAIEKEISAPKGLIQKFVKYDKKINDKWIDPLFAVIKNFTSFNLRS
ncbi:hypothetical protein D1816_23245 [Aquimarina sp. AD10]|uniref:Uncharacterized protein n=1 Tax=Aquimarina aggregata TaxID=1642818 RepID=A0A163AGW8_9FLAO|nr:MULTISPECIES: hypothetical protein [Aquimarina]AXT63134.1 hypothetical protein D1816_23245 [Aquimarina sp. AD10]KZS40538.1 hypothetical protein AWE51_06185 [Aquimarina aggregata]RKM98650.1 hypothetical protein D7033_11960 [Aquimarina sp. AD10]